MSKEVFRFFDMFGVTCHFYTNYRPKFYTPLGGLLSLLSIFISLILFISMNLDDFKRVNPSTSTSSIRTEGDHNISVDEEKIWVPWRIADYESNTVNHSEIFYPIVYYYYRDKGVPKKKTYLNRKILTYKLCSETSMTKMPENYFIDLPLNELYCIDMGDIRMGGSWSTNYIYYIEFDLYLCKDGENYEKNNSNCTSFDILSHNNNTYEIEFYYPIVQFQPTNLLQPIIIIYKDYYYLLSKYNNKIDRLFLQKYVLNDDISWYSSSKKKLNILGLWFNLWRFIY